MSIPAESGLTTLRRARRRRDGEDPGIDLLQLAKEGCQAGSALKSEQFPNRNQHHGRIQQCRRQGRERCGNPDHVSFRGRASKDVIGHGLTSPRPVWSRALAMAVGVSAARACRAVLVRFLAEGARAGRAINPHPAGEIEPTAGPSCPLTNAIRDSPGILRFMMATRAA
jgi:hypothetical protein